MLQDHTILVAVLGVIAFLMGSVPFGFLVAKLKGIDLRAIGSGNIGATNVGRALGKRWFFIILVLDASKGFMSVFIARLMIDESGFVVVPAICSILGHMFTPFLKFKGGKGVATGLGTILAIDLISAAAAIGMFLICLLITRVISISSCITAVFLAIFYYLMNRGSIVVVLYLIAVAGLVIYKHRKNFERVLSGTEPKVKTPFVN